MINRRTAIFAVAFFLAAIFLEVMASPAAFAQTFQNYRCADGTQFILFQYGSRAHLQLDGKAVTLVRRLAISGSRYSGSGVTLKLSKAGFTTLKHARRPVTTCELT